MRKKIMTKQLAVSVSEDTWNKILKTTDEEEISISSWIREAIEWHLNYKITSRKGGEKRRRWFKCNYNCFSSIHEKGITRQSLGVKLFDIQTKLALS